MTSIISVAIKSIIEDILKNLTEKFQDNIKCIILYGSWAKGSAHEDSDIDLLVVFDRIDKETGKSLRHIMHSTNTERSITIIPSSLKDFRNEKLPLYTAVKKEGKVIYGDIDLSINPEPPKIKYSEFFKSSHKFESQKIRIAEELLEKKLTSGISDLCFVASKHAIQAALSMKGKGYSSKIKILLPLAERYFGKAITQAFKKLIELYVKSEYGMEFLTEEEVKFAIEYAKKILEVYQQDA